MKKLQCVFLTLLLMSVTTACQLARREFHPEKDSLFKITFSYPITWKWKEEIPYDEFPVGEIPPPSERIVVNDGALYIQVYKPSNPQAQMQKWMDRYVGDQTNSLRSDTTIQIDGYNARWLTVIFPQITGEPLVSETVWLLTEDRFYIIDLSVPESETNGDFHQEFQGLIKSIKISL